MPKERSVCLFTSTWRPNTKLSRTVTFGGSAAKVKAEMRAKGNRGSGGWREEDPL